MFHLPAIAGTTKRLGVRSDVRASAYNGEDMIENEFFGRFTPSAMRAGPFGFLFFGKDEVMSRGAIFDGLPREVVTVLAVQEHCGAFGSPAIAEGGRHLGARLGSVLKYTFLRAGALGRVLEFKLGHSLACLCGVRLAVEGVIFSRRIDRFALDAAKQLRVSADVVRGAVYERAAVQAGKIAAGLLTSHGSACKLGENGETLYTI